ncbi:DinB family protein [Stackebrandtia nassauensis]|uniref:Mini-circle protein n=1 Tax=Stackebrandtia nassauensis (strain DSM 44728 / CIP 108903 / NRRL B-16338 / NBRC 102104 / LLR-40K-21) TaxID=446470 RepID=D3Q4I8_STANL|nr:DinB family protein [Stackebrandtia nassauensis]ADD40148.1 protein of unknown function DUF664 [Stackebrandtia nassauensis DSM 44728]
MTRTDTPTEWDERSTIMAMLDYARASARAKCEGLTDEQARTAPVATSPLTNLASLIGHLRWVEFDWIETVFLGIPDQGRTPWDDDPDDVDAEMTLALRTPLATLLSDYEQQCERYNKLIADHDLDERSRNPHPGRQPVTLRWILLHLVEEISRHNGHMDIVREIVDGQTGR